MHDVNYWNQWNKDIEIVPLGFMRGRTFKNSLIVADEMQNSTINQMKSLLTRLGENSKIIITGDLKQVDKMFENNGLDDFLGSSFLVDNAFIAANPATPAPQIADLRGSVSRARG